MSDPASDLFREMVAEPFRIKVAEKIRLLDRKQREEAYRAAFYSPAYLDSKDICIDLVTDSGTGAMSDEQWAGLMRGDEAYIRSRSWFPFEATVRRITGFEHVVPTHQGRAAEKIIAELLIKPGAVVLSNTHFDTTGANVRSRDALAVDLATDDFWSFEKPHPFKGNFDLEKLQVALERYGDRVPLLIITVSNNFACSSPVSMENIRQAKALADKHGVPVFFDACRVAENAYFIQQREPGYADKSIQEIIRETLSYGDGCWMSAKKDAIVNIGGFIATNDETLARRCQERLVMYEGFYTYGGLAGRDLEAIAVGLEEGTDEDYLAHRTGQVEYLADLLKRAGAVVSLPAGGSGVFVDVQAMYPHLPAEKLPGIAMCADFYLEGGIRVGALPFPQQTIDVKTGDIVDKVFQFARFAVPRRVYTKAHMDYVGAIAARVVERAASAKGYRIVEYPDILGHYFAKYEPLDS